MLIGKEYYHATEVGSQMAAVRMLVEVMHWVGIVHAEEA